MKKFTFSKFHLPLAVAFLLLGTLFLTLNASKQNQDNRSKAEAITPCSQRTLVLVAHEDDDLLFMNPDILHEIKSGRCLVTVYLTAGDANSTSHYQSREKGEKAAYAQMADVPDSWTQTDAGITGHPMTVFNLNGKNVSLIFMRLPDGNLDGSGFSNNSYQSLQKLWEGTISTIGTLDNSSTYTKQQLIDTLGILLTMYTPDRVYTTNYLGTYGNGDHSDHLTAAKFTYEAHKNYITPHSFVGYEGYLVQSKPENVHSDYVTPKKNSFFGYSVFDGHVCQSPAACDSQSFGKYLLRQYVTGSEGPAIPPYTPVTNLNAAQKATITSSTENVSTKQLAIKAVDGYTDGYSTGNSTHEWTTTGEKTGAWINFTWPSNRMINKVVLYDRPNLSDHVTAGKLTFSDGTSLAVGTLNNNGAATTLSFPTKNVSSVKFTITGVATTTVNSGLAEIQLFEGSSTTTPTLTPAPTTTITNTPIPTRIPTLTPTATVTNVPTPTKIQTPTPTKVPTPTPTSTTSSNGLTGYYFKNMTLSGTPALTRIDPFVNYNWSTSSPASVIPTNAFSTRWTGYVVPKYSQTYTFYTQSDDGVRLWVNGVQIINNWTNHASIENKGTITLTAGKKYSIKLEYYENTGASVIGLLWSSASQAKQIIPQSQLYSK